MIRRNICKEEECQNPVFAKKLCKYHQHLRTDKKKVNLKVNSHFAKRKKKPSGERILFESIWNTRQRKSFITGKDLQQHENFLWVNCFAHVLAKGKYPKFRLLDRNIVLLTPEEHELLDFGTEEQRQKYAEEHNCSWQPLYDLREELINQYRHQSQHPYPAE